MLSRDSEEAFGRMRLPHGQYPLLSMEETDRALAAFPDNVRAEYSGRLITNLSETDHPIVMGCIIQAGGSCLGPLRDELVMIFLIDTAHRLGCGENVIEGVEYVCCQIDQGQLPTFK